MSAEVWTPLRLVAWTAQYFREHGVPTPRLDAELLLAHVLGLERIDLYLDFERPVGGPQRARFRELVRERAQKRVPVAYLTGRREFWSRSFRVGPDALIPRPETETLVRTALELRPRRLADIGVGAGAVAVTLALELPESRIAGVDCSGAALRLARENVAGLGASDRVLLLRGDGAQALRGPLDVVVSNPPYVPGRELEHLAPEVQHEPRVALDGGPDGLDAIRRLVREAPPLLRPGGHLVLEVGHDQARPVRELLRAAGAGNVELHADLAGHERVVSARFPGGA